MRADEGTGHAGPDDDVLRCRGDPGDHRPDEGTLTLTVGPRMEVIGHLHVRESGGLGALGAADHLRGAVLLARDPISDLHRERTRAGVVPGRRGVTQGVVLGALL